MATAGEIAEYLGVVPYQRAPAPALRQPSSACQVTSESRSEMRRLLANQRRNDDRYKDPRTKFSRHFKTKGKIERQIDDNDWTYLQSDYHEALQDAVTQGANISVIATLFSHGAKIDLLKALPQAVSTWNTDLTLLLLKNCFPSQAALDKCLETALSAVSDRQQLSPYETTVIEALVVSKAKYDKRHLESALNRRHWRLADCLLQSDHRPSQAALSIILLQAVSNESYNQALVLLSYGADVNQLDGRALVTAASKQNIKMLAALVVQAQQQASSSNLTVTLQEALKRVKRTEDRLWLELLLGAGADGRIAATSTRLRFAVVDDEIPIVKLLVQHHATIFSTESCPLEAAMKHRRIEAVDIMLRGRSVSPGAGILLPLVFTNFDIRVRVHITRMLLLAGAAGEGLDQSLIIGVKEAIAAYGQSPPSGLSGEYLALLIDSKPSIDSKDAAALVLCCRAGNIHVLAQLLQQQPNENSMQHALEAVLDPAVAIPITLRSSMLECLLAYQIPDSYMEEVMNKVIQHYASDFGIIKPILKQNPKIWTSQGALVKKALDQCPTQVFEMLVKVENDPDLAGKLLRRASTKSTDKAEILLRQGTAQQYRDANLEEVTAAKPIDHKKLRMFLKYGAAVNMNSLRNVCASGDIKAIKTIRGSATDHQIAATVFAMVTRKDINRLEVIEAVIGDRTVKDAVFSDCLQLAIKEVSCVSPFQQLSHNSRGSLDTESTTLLGLLLDHGADVNHKDGAAMKSACNRMQIKLLDMLLAKQPRPNVLGSCFDHVTAQVADEAYRLILFEHILSGNWRPSIESLSNLLIASAAKESQNQDYWALLVQKGASVDFAVGEALCDTIRSRNKLMSTFLLQHRPGKDTLDHAMATTAVRGLSADDRYDAVEALLTAGARGESVNTAILVASQNHDLRLVKRLLSSQRLSGPTAANALSISLELGRLDLLVCLLDGLDDDVALSKVFDNFTDLEIVTRTDQHFACMTTVVKQNVAKASLSIALVKTIQSASIYDHREAYIDLLLQRGADPNVHNGDCVVTAIQLANLQLFSKLLKAGASGESISRAFPLMFEMGFPEARLIELIAECLEHKGSSLLQITNSWSASSLPTYLALRHYQEGARLIASLMSDGFVLPERFPEVLNHDTGEEDVSPLIAALVHKSSVAMLSTLLKLGQDVNLPARKSKITALMIASSNDEPEVIKLLLANGANLQAVDHVGRSSMVHAASSDSSAAVRALISARSSVNDGSLHEAAKEKLHEIVAALHEAGHDPNYLSTLHDGRTALLEVVIEASVEDKPAEAKLRSTIQTLQECGAKVDLQRDGKDAFFWALENAHPTATVSALIACQPEERYAMYKEGLYKDESARNYSLTMYVKKKMGLDRDAEAELLSCLRNRGCQDRFFISDTGDQPNDAVGLPDDLNQRWKERCSRLEENRLTLQLRQSEHEQRMREQRQQEQQIAQRMEREAAQRRQHEAEISRQRQAAHEQAMREQREQQEHAQALVAASDMRTAERRQAEHAIEMQRQREMHAAQLQHQRDAANARALADAESARQAQRALEDRNRAIESHRRTQIQQEQALIDYKVNQYSQYQNMMHNNYNYNQRLLMGSDDLPD